MRAFKLGTLMAILSAMLMTSGCARPSPSGLEQIIANNAAALHVPATSHVRSMQVDLTMKDGQSSFGAVYKVTRNGRMRIDIISGGKRVYTEAYDGRDAWDLGEDGSSPTTDSNPATLWHGTQFPEQILTLGDLRSLGHRLEYVGRENIGGVDYHLLKITLSDGFETFRYINPTTWLIERGRDFRAFHPAVDGKKTWIETMWSDYRPVNGVMHPFLSVNTDLTSGKWQATNTVTAISIDPNFDDSIFVRPPAKAP